MHSKSGWGEVATLQFQRVNKNNGANLVFNSERLTVIMKI